MLTTKLAYLGMEISKLKIMKKLSRQIRNNREKRKKKKLQ